MQLISVLLLLTTQPSQDAAPRLEAKRGQFVLHDFQFKSGEMLKELRLAYRTFGEPRRDEQGVVRNAVLVMHGTTGSSGSLMRPEFVNELFGPGQPLDASKYYIILPDAIGH